MQLGKPLNTACHADWSSVLSRTVAGFLVFEFVSGLAVTFGPFRPATEWNLLLHTMVGLLAITPLIWYSARHWKSYADQAMSDMLLLGYVGIAGLVVCLVSPSHSPNEDDSSPAACVHRPSNES
jgi:hypothetical protein